MKTYGIFNKSFPRNLRMKKWKEREGEKGKKKWRVRRVKPINEEEKNIFKKHSIPCVTETGMLNASELHFETQDSPIKHRLIEKRK
jgi:hypothetical protein